MWRGDFADFIQIGAAAYTAVPGTFCLPERHPQSFVVLFDGNHVHAKGSTGLAHFEIDDVVGVIENRINGLLLLAGPCFSRFDPSQKGTCPFVPRDPVPLLFV
jgi:hypothetical protein